MKPRSLQALVIALCAVCQVAQTQIYDTNNEVVQTFAGSAFYGYLDGVGQQTMFYNPQAVVKDSSGNLFVWDIENYRIRKITPGATVTTLAGVGSLSGIGNPYPMPGYGTNVYLPAPEMSASMTIDHSNALWLGL